MDEELSNTARVGGRETTFKVLHQGEVEMAHLRGYLVVGNGDAVCFFIDPSERAYIGSSTESDAGCPVIFLYSDGGVDDTEIEFSEFTGWSFHAGGGGKSIAIALVRRGAYDTL